MFRASDGLLVLTLTFEMFYCSFIVVGRSRSFAAVSLLIFSRIFTAHRLKYVQIAVIPLHYSSNHLELDSFHEYEHGNVILHGNLIAV